MPTRSRTGGCRDRREPETLTGGEELALSLGITYRKLDYWVLQGKLRPLDPQPGTRQCPRGPEAELEIARRMGRLTAAGLPLSFAAAWRGTWPSGALAPGIAVTVTKEKS